MAQEEPDVNGIVGGRDLPAPDGTVCRSVLASTEDAALPKRKQATMIAVPALRFGFEAVWRDESSP